MHPLVTCQEAKALDLAISPLKSSKEGNGQLKLNPRKKFNIGSIRLTLLISSRL